MKKKTTNYHAYIQGRNATVYWKTLTEAIIWKTLYNILHSLKRDGHYIGKIHKYTYVLITDTDKRHTRPSQIQVTIPRVKRTGARQI